MDQVTQQSKQIAELESKLKNIDKLNSNQVYSDEIKKIQEMYLK